MTINDDRTQPYRECMRCGIVTLDWKVLSILDSQGKPLEDNRYLCIECYKITWDKWNQWKKERKEKEEEI